MEESANVLSDRAYSLFCPQTCRTQKSAGSCCARLPAHRPCRPSTGSPFTASSAISAACARRPPRTCSVLAPWARSLALCCSGIRQPGGSWGGYVPGGGALQCMLGSEQRTNCMVFVSCCSCEPSPEAHIRIIEIFITTEWNESQAAPGEFVGMLSRGDFTVGGMSSAGHHPRGGPVMSMVRWTSTEELVVRSPSGLFSIP